MTSLKISAMAAAHAPSSGWFTAMMPPNGACLSVANALSHASRKFAPWPTPHGFVCFKIASVGASVAEFRDQSCRRRQIQNVVVGKFLAVELFEKLVELAVKRRRLVRVLAVAQRLRQRRGNRQRPAAMRTSSAANSLCKCAAIAAS